MAAAIAVLLTSAAAAMRMIHWAIGKMQGGDRFKDTWEMIISFPISVVFLTAIYFAVIVMFTGKNFIDLVNRYVPYFDIRSSWNTLRYVLLGAIFFAIVTKSATYALVYGSLASIVLLMLWLYWCCCVIIYGAVINVAIRDTKEELLKAAIAEERRKNRTGR